MQIKFNLQDEKTVTSTSVKVSVAIKGTVGDDTREQLENRAREITGKLFSDARWAFQNFRYEDSGMTFSVSAITRVDAAQVTNLSERAAEVSSQTMRMLISHIDDSIPLHDIRQGQSAIRINLLDMAEKEAERLGGKVTAVDFTNEGISRALSKNAFATASASYSADGGGSGLGNSEKVEMSATITVER